MAKTKREALEGTRPVLPEIVRPEIAALGTLIGLGWDWHRGEADRVSGFAHVEQPGVAEALATIGEIGLVGEHQKVAIGEKVPALIAVLKMAGTRPAGREGTGPTTGNSGNVIGSNPPGTFVDWQGSH